MAKFISCPTQNAPSKFVVSASGSFLSRASGAVSGYRVNHKKKPESSAISALGTSSAWRYLLFESRTPRQLIRRAERIAEFINDGYEVLNGSDFSILVKLIVFNPDFAVSMFFDLLQAMIGSQNYQKRMIAVVETTMLYSKKADVRYAALELLSEVIEKSEVQDILERAEKAFSDDETDYVRQYFEELRSLLL